MKNPANMQSATSLPRAPRDEAQTRMRKYFVMMTVRVLCFVLMVIITPYGWYTWVLAAGAIFLPYFAVVIANVAAPATNVRAVPPERSLTGMPAPAPPAAPSAGVILLHESTALPPATDSGPPAARP